MKKIIYTLFFLFLITNLINCDEKETIPQDLKTQNFVWKALNFYYLWQDDTPDLQDDRFNTQDELNSFLENRQSQDVFDNLLHTEDRFSWFVEDYIAQAQLFSGISLNNGMV